MRQAGVSLVAVAVAAAVLLTSCTTTTWGSKIDDSQFAGFQNGVTTLQDVERALGPPQKTQPGPDAGTTELVYWYNVMRSSKYARIPFAPPGHIEADVEVQRFEFDNRNRLLGRFGTIRHLDSRDLAAPASPSS